MFFRACLAMFKGITKHIYLQVYLRLRALSVIFHFYITKHIYIYITKHIYIYITKHNYLESIYVFMLSVVGLFF